MTLFVLFRNCWLIKEVVMTNLRLNFILISNPSKSDSLIYSQHPDRLINKYASFTPNSPQNCQIIAHSYSYVMHNFDSLGKQTKFGTNINARCLSLRLIYNFQQKSIWKPGLSKNCEFQLPTR